MYASNCVGTLEGLADMRLRNDRKLSETHGYRYLRRADSDLLLYQYQKLYTTLEIKQDGRIVWWILLSTSLRSLTPRLLD